VIRPVREKQRPAQPKRVWAAGVLEPIEMLLVGVREAN
jgi:hypothetical protein